MTLDRDLELLQSQLKELCSLPQETEWVEFKKDNDDPSMIGEYISALSNSAALLGKKFAYVVWGIEDETHVVTGTNFKPSKARYKQQELESWLLQKITPKIHFSFYEFSSINGLPVVILEINAAANNPVQFDSTEFIRIDSYKKKLKDFPEKERALWRELDKTPFERQIALSNLTDEKVLSLLDYPAYFDLMKLPLPENRAGILNAFKEEQLIMKASGERWDITNLAAILFAKELSSFVHLARKVIRIIFYNGNNRIETIRELCENKGYAVGFERLIDYLKALLPSNEEIGKAFRKEVPMYPELSIRELVANAIIHQDFSITGTGPMVEIFSTRMEITNPGIPLVATERFLDSPPRSRNEALASFMRRINICEERGSGVDKVVFQTEFYQLPAPLFEVTENHTRAILFAFKAFADMDKEDRIRACYLHCCLKYVSREQTNNRSLRERFGIEQKKQSQVSRVIQETVTAGLIRPYDSSAGSKAMHYVPKWA